MSAYVIQCRHHLVIRDVASAAVLFSSAANCLMLRSSKTTAATSPHVSPVGSTALALCSHFLFPDCLI